MRDAEASSTYSTKVFKAYSVLGLAGLGTIWPFVGEKRPRLVLLFAALRSVTGVIL